jgi:hypothetical protein
MTTRKTGLTLLTAAAISLLGMQVGSAQFDQVCLIHVKDTDPKTHDPKIETEVYKFAIRLLTGDPSFMADWNAYLLGLDKEDYAGTTTGSSPNDRVADASTDLHCDAPVEVRRVAGSIPNSNALDVDNWRGYVTAAVLGLESRKRTLQEATDLLNTVKPYDRAVAVADFNRDCVFRRLPLIASLNPAGMIEIVDNPNPLPPP